MQEIAKYLAALSLLAVATLSGCAVTPQNPMSEEVRQKITTDKVALNVHAPRKKLYMSETLYRVLWLQFKDDTVSFDGIWDIESDLTPLFVNRFAAVEITTDPVSSEAIDSYRAAFVRQFDLAEMGTMSTSGGTTSFSEGSFGPLDEFYSAAVALPEFEPVRNELADLGYRYFIDLNIPTVHATAPGYGLVTVGVAIFITVVDLQMGEVAWAQRLRFGEGEQLGGDLNKLQIDGMAKLKSMINEAISDSSALPVAAGIPFEAPQ